MMKKTLWVLIIMLFLGTTHANADEIYALYGFSQELFEGKNPVQIIRILKKWRVNTLFIGKNDFDLIPILHGSGIKVYYELSCFSGTKYWERYPDSRPITKEGEPIPQVKWYAGLCPNHAKIKQEKLAELRSVLRKHEVDGVWLDFVRYPCHWEFAEPALWHTCFCRNCMSLFQKHIGVPIATPEDILIHYRTQWVAWRCRRITDFVREVRTIVDEEQPGTVVGLFSVPWKEEDFANAIEWVIGQKYADLANYVDVFSPMVYHRMSVHEISWIHEYVRYLADKTGKGIIPIVQARDEKVNIHADEFRMVLENALQSPSQGVIILEAQTIVDKEWGHILQEHLR